MFWRHALPKQTDSLRWISIRASTPSCLWRLVDARLHLVLIELMALALNDIKRSKMFKDVQRHPTTPSFQLPKNSLVLPCGSNPKRLGITWDHVLKACPWSHLLTAQALASAGLVHSYPLEKKTSGSGKSTGYTWFSLKVHGANCNFWPHLRKVIRMDGTKPSNPGHELRTLTLSAAQRVLHWSKLRELPKRFLKAVSQSVNPQISKKQFWQPEFPHISTS